MGSAIHENRVLAFATSQRELEFTSAQLQHGDIAAQRCADLDTLLSAMDEGAGCVVVTAEGLKHPSTRKLVDWLAAQPTWSELPFIVLARTEEAAAVAGSMLNPLTFTTVLDRPVRARTLASAVHASLRARDRQYEIRRHLESLQSAWTELEVVNRAKDEFLAVLAHELRNPLAPIRAAAQFLKTGETSAQPARLKAHDMIGRQLTHLVRLVDDLLDVSRIALGRVQVQSSLITLQGVLNDAIEAVRPLIEGSQHNLLLQLPEAPIYVEGDGTRLTQVFQNLLNNAARYTPPGGTIALAASADAGMVTVRVVDNGIGIRAELMDKLFQPFVQGSRKLLRAQGGLGVGLSLAHRLVELHQGTLRVESEGEGHGSEFIVKLPLSSRAPKRGPMETTSESSAAGASATPARTIPQVSCRVLVVDDNIDAAESLTMLLELEGASVRQAHNGYQALAIAREFDADVVVLDIGMPGLDGYAVCRELRAMPHGEHRRILALTGWGQQEDRRKTREAGFDAHLVKPVDPEQLTRILTDVSAAVQQPSIEIPASPL